MKNLNDLFLDELAETYATERAVAKALPEMAAAATCRELRELLHTHLQQSKRHQLSLRQLFRIRVLGKNCEATTCLLEEVAGIVGDYGDASSADAALILMARKIGHHKMATYSCLQVWAEALGNAPAAELMTRILDHEGAADAGLLRLSRCGGMAGFWDTMGLRCHEVAPPQESGGMLGPERPRDADTFEIGSGLGKRGGFKRI